MDKRLSSFLEFMQLYEYCNIILRGAVEVVGQCNGQWVMRPIIRHFEDMPFSNLMEPPTHGIQHLLY